MAVEIVILSGSRQGQRFESALKAFRVGATPDCELSFDAQLDPGAYNCAVFFRLEDDGWRIRSVGTTGVLINSTVARSDARLRSGDIIRLSPSGPDFSFNIVARSAAHDTSSEPSPERRSAAPTESTLKDPLTSVGISRSAAWAAAVALVLIVSLMSWRLVGSKPGPELVATENVPSASIPAKSAGTASNSLSPPVPTTVSPQPPPESENAAGGPAAAESAPAESAPAGPAVPANPWPLVLNKLSSAIFLLATEQTETHSTWPIATACAVGETTLLTSANMAIELAATQRQGQKLWAINEPLGIRAEVQSLRVHVGYEKSTGEPEQQIYFDLALINVAVKLKVMVDLADAKDLSELDSGYPLGCMNIPHKVELMSRFQSNQPELLPCKVFVITSLPPPPGPRLLHLIGDFPTKPNGGFLVNAEGKVVAVFAETSPAEGADGLILHYAPVVNRELVKLGIGAVENEIWVTPTVPESNDKR